MAPSSLDKQTAGYKSLHDWLVRLGMDLAVLVLCETDKNQLPFGKLSTMAGNSASYSFNSWCIDIDYE